MKTKERGLHRKCENMVRRITEQTQVFPWPHEGSGYWHLHLPVARNFLRATNTSFGVRRLCVQTLIDRAHHLAGIAPVSKPSTRVVVAINLPELWNSQIIVFFGSSYFDTFFQRNTTAQRWTKIAGGRSLTKDWKTQVPADFSEIGYDEEIQDEDCAHTGKIWFIGQ